LAVPTGVALIGWGISLWRNQPTTVGDNPTCAGAEHAEHAAAQ
jgi:hypothetical protein